MNTTSREELIELGRGREEICVSIYTSVDVADQGKAAATIRLKNHFPMIEASLAKRGMGPAEIKKILRPIHQLAQQRLADLPPCHGLAMFVTEHSCRSEPLPIEVDDVAWVGRRFYVRPLLGLLRRDRGYWLLSVSQNRARLFHGSANGLVEQALQDLPLGVTDVVDESSHDGTRQAHTARQGGTIRQDAEYHGQGGLADHKKLNIEKYLRAVDRSIEPLLRSDPLPLVFAGVDYLYPMFAELTQCSQILSEHIHGNPDLVSPAQLHERACAILKPFFDRRQSETLVRLNAMQGRPLASDSVHEILPAAADGRVQSLLVHDTGPLWGAFDPVRRTVHAETEQLPDSEDLIDLACVEVLDHGGEVFAVSWQELKSGAPMSAILRYENAATPVLPATV